MQIKMRVTSPAFKNNEVLPVKYTCDGEGFNPPLEFSQIPPNSKSLVIICDDPDAPSGTFCHWLIWNINPQETHIAERSVPQGSIQGITSSGRPGYVPACPPSGSHRYVFKLYALDTLLELPSSADQSQVEQLIQNHIIEQAELVGLYSKSDQ